MAQTALSLATALPFVLQPKTSPLFSSSAATPSRNRATSTIQAKLGEGDGEIKRREKRFITREEEPDQYWLTAAEKKGENPMKTPLPYIFIFGMLTPFVMIAIAFANGWIKVPVR